MSGDQVMYATQASSIVFIVDRERSRDVCAAEILGENYRAISEKFYLGFEDEEAPSPPTAHRFAACPSWPVRRRGASG